MANQALGFPAFPLNKNEAEFQGNTTISEFPPVNISYLLTGDVTCRAAAYITLTVHLKFAVINHTRRVKDSFIPLAH